MADEIYDLTEENDNLSVENKGLRNQLGTCLNEDQLKKYCQEEKLKLGTDTNRNNRILERLNKRLEESRKQIKYSSNAANAFVPRVHCLLDLQRLFMKLLPIIFSLMLPKRSDCIKLC